MIQEERSEQIDLPTKEISNLRASKDMLGCGLAGKTPHISGKLNYVIECQLVKVKLKTKIRRFIFTKGRA